MRYSQPIGAARDLPGHNPGPARAVSIRRRPAITEKQRQEQEIRRLRDVLLGYEPGTYADRRRAFQQLQDMGVTV